MSNNTVQFENRPQITLADIRPFDPLATPSPKRPTQRRLSFEITISPISKIPSKSPNEPFRDPYERSKDVDNKHFHQNNDENMIFENMLLDQSSQNGAKNDDNKTLKHNVTNYYTPDRSDETNGGGNGEIIKNGRFYIQHCSKGGNSAASPNQTDHNNPNFNSNHGNFGNKLGPIKMSAMKEEIAKRRFSIDIITRPLQTENKEGKDDDDDSYLLSFSPHKDAQRPHGAFSEDIELLY
ncbi:hypothetical protein TRFO_01478 [Tritrichomonas foetus]|uniref:Uncharacterized protein n=1 Tax=Tritrichomonas foetus TaxID=1144522 RepID=A0A1J4JXC0_9EUKA|nr:hypothetical protein TRFO_01478 [Tritrichomonas foetus]|eukprot:OHT03799.1 hypothetical protein TRFO_01478 [Tritrichomonas foetus]